MVVILPADNQERMSGSQMIRLSWSLNLPAGGVASRRKNGKNGQQSNQQFADMKQPITGRCGAVPKQTASPHFQKPPAAADIDLMPPLGITSHTPDQRHGPNGIYILGANIRSISSATET